MDFLSRAEERPTPETMTYRLPQPLLSVQRTSRLVTGTKTDAAVALATKPEVGVGFVLPVVLYALFRRHLLGRSNAPLAKGALEIALVGAPSIALFSHSRCRSGLALRS